MRPDDVTDFVIVPPYEPQRRVGAEQELLSLLKRRFPGFGFHVASVRHVACDHDFSVLPVMEYVGDNAQSRPCRRPSRWLLAEIREACRSFEVGRIPTRH